MIIMSDKNQPSWEALILHRSIDAQFKSRTCKIYNNKSESLAKSNELCPCGRMIRRHSFTGESLESKVVKTSGDETNKWQPPTTFADLTHSTPVPVNVFGTLKPTDCKFLRITNRPTTIVKDVYKLILEDCGNSKPALILSVYGGAKYFTMTERLEKEFIRGIIDAATVADGWILTAGINNGVSKVVGEGISHYSLLREYPKRVKCIGLTMWGTINDNTRVELKKASSTQGKLSVCERQIPENAQEDKEAIEPNHTHCILFDGGKLTEYLSDGHRSSFVKEACDDKSDNHTCYPVTIMVEGGVNSLEVLENDIKENRPIVLIQGSGRLADVLAALLEQTSNPERNQYWEPSKNAIEQAIERFYPSIPNEDISSTTKGIEHILKLEHRHLLHVFCMDRDKNVAEIIFKAIFTASNKKNKIKNDKTDKDSSEQEKQRRIAEDKLVDLGLEWNYFDGVLPILQSRHNERNKNSNIDFTKDDKDRQKELFRKSLEKNRPQFIEYFLSAGFDPLTLADKDDIFNYQMIISNLYSTSFDALNTSHKNRVKTLFGPLPLHSVERLDYKLNKFVGSFFSSIYSYNGDHYTNRIKIDMINHVFSYCRTDVDTGNDYQSKDIHNNNNEIEIKYTKQHMLRDLFLWSIFMDMSEMAKVLLLHIRSRICAALIASAVFKKYAELSPTVYMKDKFRAEALEFETYAGMSVDKCYEYNEKRACELLLRQIPLFGNVTCMQVAIASESGKLLETACFDQTLNQVWYYKLSVTNHYASAKLKLIPALLTFGLLAPLILDYRKDEKRPANYMNEEALSARGVDYYYNRPIENQFNWKTYWKRFLYFHDSPMIKMAYHFISYIFFLLVFSYMMLYHLDRRDTFTVPHWTEIYVIITVSTMFCEEIRKLYHEYTERMVERWGSTGSTLLTALSNIFYILPYFLFYLGIGFRYASYSDGLLSTARIIWALDLELWYLRSLKFVIALKFLGPKLFMLKNMLRDLFAFVYLIFIAIAAYGVVSRALVFYQQVPFTAYGIFSSIFYPPYWFIYGTVSDKDTLDKLISNETSTVIAEATATHVLLAFHMLFINILLLNLLIAVFADSIGKVQENTEFYWRYQRYSFIREYFERLPLSYPPLIIISHLILFILFLQNKLCPRLFNNKVDDGTYVPLSKRITHIFKMISIKDSRNEQWDLFENAATHSYARSVLEKHENKDDKHVDYEKSNPTMTTTESNITQTDQKQTVETLRDELTQMKSILIDLKNNMNKLVPKQENI